jgi:hypothetical protein
MLFLACLYSDKTAYTLFLLGVDLKPCAWSWFVETITEYILAGFRNLLLILGL